VGIWRRPLQRGRCRNISKTAAASASSSEKLAERVPDCSSGGGLALRERVRIAKAQLRQLQAYARTAGSAGIRLEPSAGHGGVRGSISADSFCMRPMNCTSTCGWNRSGKRIEIGMPGGTILDRTSETRAAQGLKVRLLQDSKRSQIRRRINMESFNLNSTPRKYVSLDRT